MKDNKLYKVLRIIFLTLAIISLVFTLCKKVGLCASSGGGSVSYVPTSSSELPFPLYNFSPIPDSVITSCVEASYSSAWGQYFGGNDWIFVVVEDNETKYHCRVFYCAKITLSTSWENYFAGQGHINYDVDGGVEFYLNKSDFSMVDMSYRGSDFSLSYGAIGSANPAGQGKVFVDNTVYSNYPCASYDSTWYIDSSSSYGAGDLVFSVPESSGITFENGEVTSLPSFDSLPGNVDSSDDEATLFDKLKGWLSTLSGNIQKGFKNIEENLTSFFKPYLDNIKGFFDWVTEPFDPEAASDSLEAIQAISDIRALNNVIGTSGIFDWDDVTPASRVAFTFDFGGAVLPHHQYEVNFDWYTGTVKTLILSILVTFLVVGLLVTIINNIPSMIHGHSGDSGGGSN